MKKSIIVVSLALFSIPSYAFEKIQSEQAPRYVNQLVTVCGHVAQIKPYKDRIYLNLGRAYPNQDLALVIWEQDKTKYPHLNSYLSQRLCTTGRIKEYKGQYQITVNEPNALSREN